MTVEMHKVLIIANLYDASPRVPRLAKRFPSNGWECTIITPMITKGSGEVFNAPPTDLERKGIRLVQTGEIKNYEQSGSAQRFGGLKKTTSIFIDKLDPDSKGRLKETINRRYWQLYSTIKYPDPEKGWESDALSAGRKTLSGEKFDLIMSTSSPITTHVVARQLKREFNIPWLAEYRDLWSQNHNQPLGPMMRAFQRRLERRTIGDADAIVTVTDPWVDDLKRLFPEKKIFCLPIGFEPNEKENEKLTSSFTITYTGQIYQGKQDPIKFLDALTYLIGSGKIDRSKVEVRFYGPVDERLAAYIKDKNVGDYVSQRGVVCREEAIKRQLESQVLLMFNWEDKKQLGWMGLKLIEYLSTGRPIINSGGHPGSLTAKIIEETDTGKAGIDKEDIARIILEYYEEFMRDGKIRSRGKPDMIDRYNFDRITADYAKVFSSLVP